MRQSRSQLVLLLAAASPAFAFPALNQPLDVLGPLLDSLTGDALAAFKTCGAALANPPFDAKAQYVSTTGFHKFKAPGPNDHRGPCPGLNAMANHGYLPHNGQPTLVDFVLGTKAAFGMCEDLSLILAAYGGLFDGILAAWSIGGGFHTGIGGSHNNYETDSSPLRGDLDQYGSNTDLVMSQFHTLYNMQPDAATANYDLSVMAAFRAVRLNESIAKNPRFTYLPFSGVAVSQAAYSFIYRFMSNKTAEHPAGVLNKSVLKSFMSITGPENNLTWTPGHERFPDNWYRRNDGDLYGLLGLVSDFGPISRATGGASNRAGCNTGTVNSFQLIDVASMTNGTYTDDQAAANPLCFAIAYANSQLTIPAASNVVQELLLPIQNLLGCVTVPGLNESVYDACPGYSVYGGPTGRVAAGAIQN